VIDVQDMGPIKNQYHIPSELQSCHTAIVDGYVIEGHVPVSDIHRLLAEKPEAVGLAVAGMPIGSPGMEAEDAPMQPYEVILFMADGSREIYADYP
jgi:hypothetical protein